MRAIKCGLGPLVQNEGCLLFLERTAQRVHELKTGAHLLCKAYILKQHEERRPLPAGEGAIKSLFIDSVNAIARFQKGTPSRQRLQLNRLRDEIFPSGFTVNRDGLCNWPKYASKNYAKAVGTHIKRCYCKCLRKYLASMFVLENKDPELNAIMNAFIRCDESVPLPAEELSMLRPTGRELVKNSVAYDVKSHPYDYLGCMLHMARHLEGVGLRSYAVLPLIASQIPGSFLLDTDTLLELIPTNDPILNGISKKRWIASWRTSNPSGKPGHESKKRFTDAQWARKQDRLQRGQAALWGRVLKLNALPRCGGAWTFDNRIQTDGVSVTLYARRTGEHLLKEPKEFTKYADENYVEDLRGAERDATLLRAQRCLVAIDPGKINIISAVEAASVVHADGRVTARRLRYTAKQRAFETRRAEARERAAAFRGISAIDLDAWEAQLAAAPSRRTLVFADLCAHVTAFYAYAGATRPFWQETFHRAERLNAYRRRQRSGARLMNAFAAKFGPPSDVVVAFGDGTCGNLRGRAPGPSTAIRRLFQRHHYEVVDVSEPYTSKRCFRCEDPAAENGPCRTDFSKGKSTDAWGVRRCNCCGTTWDRDFHACLNIDRIARRHLNRLARPEYLSVRN